MLYYKRSQNSDDDPAAAHGGGVPISLSATQSETRRPLLLVVDDNQSNLDMLSRRLKRKGYAVITADNAGAAQVVMREQGVDLVLLDINMPDMNGYEFCRWLKRDDALKEIPVIFLSARADTLDKVQAFDSGGVDYLTKPIHIEELYVRVDTHLKLRKIQMELEHKNAELQKTLHALQTTQAQLIQSEKLAALGVMAAGIAHEINNPLNYILAGGKALSLSVERIRGLFKQEPRSRELLDDIEEMIANITSGAERTAEIVQGLRGFSRLDVAVKSPVDLHGSIDAALILLRHKHQNSIEVRKDYGAIPMIRGFPGRLDQVFVNLLGNAIDAVNGHGGQGLIQIRTRLTDKDNRRMAAITITDNGPGLSAAAQEHLFEPFFTTKDVGAGTGLGLAISLGIVESHGGAIEAGNQPGNGAIFTIYLPLDE